MALDCCSGNLESLHLQPVSDAASTPPALHKAQVQAQLASAASLEERKKQKRSYRRHAGWAAFLDSYWEFVHDVILPHLEGYDLLVQEVPVLRCVLPGSVAPSKPHCDADYFHDPSELNFWVPLTAVEGSNSLFCESAPGRADFAPFQLQYGEIMRFYGNRCRHYTVPNDSSVRVSFDFRVIPAHLAHDIDASGRKDIVCSQWRLADGGYYRLVRQKSESGPPPVAPSLPS